MNFSTVRSLLAGLCAGVLFACVPEPPATTPGVTADTPPVMTKVTFDQLPGWTSDNVSQALAPFVAGCGKLGEAVLNGEPRLGGGGPAGQFGGTAAQWQSVCAQARKVRAGDDAAARVFFETAMQPYAVTAGQQARGLFTGYYEPEIAGSRSPGGAYKVALLSRPSDLVPVEPGTFDGELKSVRAGRRTSDGTVVPYYDRAEIEGGALAGKRLDLIWVADPVDAFFLHIQGAGRIRLPDGKVARVSYAGQNGRTYVPIGRVLVERGEMTLDAVSMQSIRGWLRAHPAEAPAMMAQNPSYVFFREIVGVKPGEGPPGTLNVPLTPGRSIAVDRSVIPLGAPVWLDTTDPVDGSPLRRLMLAQDTGGAIRGAIRADVFWGWGAEAEEKAGRMRSQGSWFVLLPKAP